MKIRGDDEADRETLSIINVHFVHLERHFLDGSGRDRAGRQQRRIPIGITNILVWVSWVRARHRVGIF
jgi:hypothetical protein